MSTRGISKARIARANTIDDKEIGLRIRAMRIDKKISQGDLATKLGVSFQQIQKYEKGSNRVSATRLMKIAQVLKTTPHDLMGWDGVGKIGTIATFDAESYKLARIFVKLPDRTKPAIRALISSLLTSEKQVS